MNADFHLALPQIGMDGNVGVKEETLVERWSQRFTL